MIGARIFYDEDFFVELQDEIDRELKDNGISRSGIRFSGREN